MLARDFLELARELAEKGSPSSAELRTALGRAYYAVYNSGVECQKNLGLRFHTGRDSGKNHSLVRDRFGDVTVDDGRRLYNDLKDLQRMRHCADYDLSDSDVEDSGNVMAHVDLAEETLALIEQFQTSSSKADIVRELNDYDRRKGLNL